jgi:hypothetical protein
VKTVTFEINDEQHAEFAQAAKAAGMLRDHYARIAVLDKVEKDLNKNKK